MHEDYIYSLVQYQDRNYIVWPYDVSSPDHKPAVIMPAINKKNQAATLSQFSSPRTASQVSDIDKEQWVYERVLETWWTWFLIRPQNAEYSEGDDGWET